MGDAYFQQKSFTRIRKYREKGGSIIFVSHDLNAMKQLCDKAALLYQGKLVEFGDPESVVNYYNYLLAKLGDTLTKNSDNQTIRTKRGTDYGNYQITVVKVVLEPPLRSAQPDSSLLPRAKLHVDIQSQVDLDDVSVGFVIRDRLGQDIYGTNSFLLEKKLSITKGQKRKVVFEFNYAFVPGKYTVTVAVHPGRTHIENCFHWVDRAVEFEVVNYHSFPFAGLCDMASNVEIFESEFN